MGVNVEALEFGEAWCDLLKLIEADGEIVRPRGLVCKELRAVQFTVLDAQCNLLYHPRRKLAYKFAVAEWLWIWFGRKDVKTIAQYNPNIKQYSDDGETFAGAYGPRLHPQIVPTLELLQKDSDTRQAVMTIFTPNPEPSKDIPCTLSVQFMIRDETLHTIVTMRSSDIWLGLPYDMFNFSMFANVFAGALGVELGSITFNLGSSHLYSDKFLDAHMVGRGHVGTIQSPMMRGFPPQFLKEVLVSAALPRETLVTSLPYIKYAGVLTAKTNVEALTILRGLEQ